MSQPDAERSACRSNPSHNAIGLRSWMRVRFIGEIRRQDLVTRFGIQSGCIKGSGAAKNWFLATSIRLQGQVLSWGPDFQPVA